MSPEGYLSNEFKEFLKTNIGKEIEKSGDLGDVP